MKNPPPRLAALARRLQSAIPASVPRHAPGARTLGSATLLCMAFSAQIVTAQSNAPASLQAAPPIPSQPLHITLEDAIARARKVSPTLETALTNAKIAAEATVQARAANLPTVSANSQYLYTEGNGTAAARFIANNGVHEYIAQADVHQTLSAPLLIAARSSALLQAAARDQAIVAQRGLVVAVVQSYAALVAANGKLQALQEALDAAQQFLKTTQQLETGGEVAHADVIKARLQQSDSQVALNDAQQVREQARLALALLIFQDVNQPFAVAEDPAQMLQLPAFAPTQALAHQANPDIGAALNTERAASKDVTSAWSEYLPSMTFDYFYGVDANQFASRSVDYTGRPVQNLGYSALASLNIPIFNWGATHSRVKQAQYRHQQAATALSYAKRRLTASISQFYAEAQTAQQEMAIRQGSVADAEQSRKLILLQYKAGEATALEVVNSEATVGIEKTAFYDAETRFDTALASLATLTGSLQ